METVQNGYIAVFLIVTNNNKAAIISIKNRDKQSYNEK
jgi:hypothetical protein